MTKTVPFVTAFVTDQVSEQIKRDIVAGLEAAKDDQELLKALESKAGFKAIEGPAVAKKN